MNATQSLTTEHRYDDYSYASGMREYNYTVSADEMGCNVVRHTGPALQDPGKRTSSTGRSIRRPRTCWDAYG
eukprot:scaffold1839_cov31-Prasinocladus_malaysianus.AAC.1